MVMSSEVSRWTTLPILWTLFLAGIVVSIPAPAQPIAVFELDDYLDPRLLGSQIAGDGSFQPGDRFFITELFTGVITDFEHQGLYSEGRTEFAHAKARLYFGRQQLNLLATIFDPRASPRFGRERRGEPGAIPEGERARVIPDERLRLQYGWYRFGRGTSDKGFVNRFLLSAGVSETAAGDRIYDLGWVLDLPLSISSRNILGSIGYDWRIVDGGFDQHRILYFYRWANEAVLEPKRGPFGPLNLPVRLSFGAERSETHWRTAPIRLEVGLSASIERLRTMLHFTYAPSFRSASRGFEQKLNHEFAVFLEGIPLSKVFPAVHKKD